MNGVKVYRLFAEDADRTEAPARAPEESGFALLLAILVSVLLSVLVLTLATTGLSGFRDEVDFEGHTQALMIADGGLWLTKDSLRGQDLESLIAQTSTLPVYANASAPQDGSNEARNPITYREARNVDFDSIPSPTGNREMYGLLTPAGGAVLGSGHYFAKLSDNRDESLLGLGLLDDPLTDRDNLYILRVTGVHPASHEDKATYGTTRKNAVAVLEALIGPDGTFNLPGVVTTTAPDCISQIDGNAFTIDGYDHAGMTFSSGGNGHNDLGLEEHPGIATLYDDPSNSDGVPCRDGLFGEMTQHEFDNIKGSDGDYAGEPSLADATETVRNASNPDNLNMLSADYLASFVERVQRSADRTFATDASVTSSTLGTPEDPQITVAMGDLDLSGNGTGAGLLVVKGDLSMSGSYLFEGLVIVLGGDVEFTGAAKTIVGAIYVANLEEDSDSNSSLGSVSFRVGGRANLFYASDRIEMASRLLPLSVYSWREVTPEIEP